MVYLSSSPSMWSFRQLLIIRSSWASETLAKSIEKTPFDTLA